MKKLNKKVLDKCIEMTRQYWQGEADGEDFLQERLDVAEKSGCSWLALVELLDSLLSRRGFKPNAANTEIYDILIMLGWVIADEEVETSESL